MKTAIVRIAVFAVAFRTQGKRRHHRKWPVIGHSANNGEAWSTVGAIDERITVAPLAWGIHLGKTCRAGRRIRHDLRVHRTACALTNGEIRRCALPYQRRVFNAVNARQRRAILIERGNKLRRLFQQPNDDAVAVITHVAV
ncbi:Uncharacterised protein [Salmonella enterica subsp. enterica serovar Bovismorbificans]|uniref:Uncharacterized protein n=1 Tax=Salmonella enterica subsp. enterica serovar Bovismorbificans TaxID=58097 RepID=A0A655EL50_SALET|nr:Uncharacterised protein [Salmonella enterica subsp. enterica serovar Bovismorbificans]CNV34425.1 Uncharacterised protein [Salmonella enterica subsp. enterica serovar Bovismorbificans]